MELSRQIKVHKASSFSHWPLIELFSDAQSVSPYFVQVMPQLYFAWLN